MKLLLDTHIWLWSVVEPQRLSQSVRDEIQDPLNELWLSPISIWELIVLHQKGRLLPEPNIEIWISEALQALPLREASLTNEVAREIGRLQFPNRDPADRFLIATAKVFELTLVTADERLLTIQDVPILPNR